MLELLEAGSLVPHKPVQLPAAAIQFLLSVAVLNLILLLGLCQHIAGLCVSCVGDQLSGSTGIKQDLVIGNQYYVY